MKKAKTVWAKAQGSCGFHVGKNTIEVAHVNGIALFAFENRLSTKQSPLFTCVITGHDSYHGTSMDEVKATAERIALRNVGQGNQVVSAKRLKEFVADKVRFPVVYQDALVA